MTFSLIADDEIFVDIEGFEKLYSISNYGRIFSHHGRSNKCLATHDNGKGYLQLRLCDAKRCIYDTARVHVLVGQAFIGHRTDGLSYDHINRNTHDNRASNIRLATHSEQMVNQGTRKCNKLGEKNIHLWTDTKDNRVYFRILIRRNHKRVLQASYLCDKYTLDYVCQKRDEFIATLDY